MDLVIDINERML